MKCKKLIFIVSLMLILSIPITSYAEDYGTDYPNYVPYSGGAYIEVQSTLGRGSLVFQDTYKNNYFGFYGTGYDVFNISNSTITGRYITVGGTEYQARLTSFNTVQYYYSQGTVREWRDLVITKIYNTNCTFIDYTGADRNNQIDVFDNAPYKYTVACLLFLANLFGFIFIIRCLFYD